MLNSTKKFLLRGWVLFPLRLRLRLRLPSLSPLLLLLLLFPVTACTTGRQGSLGTDATVFPPDQLLPLKIAITKPLQPVDLQDGHRSLLSWNESPGQRRQLMNCTWKDGLANFMRLMVPGTEVVYLGAGRDPLAAVGPGVSSRQDSLGATTFSLDVLSAVDVARHRGWSHLVVPENLNFQFDAEKQNLVLACPAAIIDVQERRIVWQGNLDSRQVRARQLGSDDSTSPSLTRFETTSYLFVLDLMKVLNRQLNTPPASRNLLASPCQDPPPLLRDGP